MSDRDRDVDPIVARALHDLPIPDHAPGFWAELDDRLAAVDAPTTAPRRADDDEVVLVDDDAAPVVSLDRARSRRELRRGWLVAAAAAVLAIALGVVLRPGGDHKVETADPGPDTSATSDPTTPDTTAAPFGGDAAEAQAAVRAWLDAVSTGDIETARGLTGPRTVAYIESLGGTIDGFLQESSEGWGAWPASPDLRMSTHTLPEETGVSIVVVQGTWTGEGETYFRTDAIPVVNEDGRWLVEINAFRPDVGGRIEFVEPEVTNGGFSYMPGTDIVVSAPGGGDFYAAFDDPGLNPVSSEHAAGTKRATFSHQDLSLATHLLVVAYLDGDTITAFAGRVTVTKG